MKILNELTIKHLKMNKKRTIVTIIGIILSTALMVGIGLLFSTIQDNSIRTFKEETGDYHALLSGISKNKLDVISNNHHVDSYFYESPIGFSEFKEGNVTGRKYIYVNAVTEDYFKQMKLIKGRFPENSKEIVISNQLEMDNGEIYKIGDEITLNIGKRANEESILPKNVISYDASSETLVDTGEYEDTYEENVSESLIDTKVYTYKIVGIIEKPVFEPWNAAGYTFLTKIDTQNQNVNVYLKFKKPSKAYQDMEALAKNLGITKDSEEEISYNNSLLALYGASRYSNIMNAIINVMIIILTLISIGCIIVIYNSFAISVMERKKQFGLFSSIGATKKQLRQTVFFEAIIVGAIGIPLGIIGSFIGIGIVIAIINYLVPSLFGTNLVLTAYPIFLMIPILFMIITILLSAYIPAHQASKITPIEAIRLNDDIKVKSRKLKTGKWSYYLFGIEGEIALKNIKRNKKKYRITIVSLFISIVLFISFSTFVEYGLKTSSGTLNIPDYDISIRLRDPSLYDYEDLINTVRNYEGVQQSISIKSGKKFTTSYQAEDFFDKQLLDYFNGTIDTVQFSLISLDEESYVEYLKELGLEEQRPILINQTKYVSYKNNNRTVYHSSVLKDPKKNYSFNLCDPIYETEEDVIGEPKFDCGMILDNIYVTEKAPFAIESDFLNEGKVVLVIPSSIFEQLFKPEMENYFDDITIYLKVPKYKKLDDYMTNYLDNLSTKSNILYFNYPKEMRLMKNLYIVVALLLYGFIALVTLIGITSVFNTINTSIQLRRKEFAMLRSMGLTPHGFNKILYFESFFFGIKSLIYGIPFSFLVVIWIHNVMMNINRFEDVMIPWKSVGIAILAVFIIVFLTMMYATKKMKKENILDAIREENI
ncbi:MAG: ABC transporter permease [Bacilli bacterium]|nr:ABC transporter permease [Bacilli bacterium]